MEGELGRKMREYEVKLESCEDASRRTISELRQMLTSQQRVASKWKEECNSMTKQFDDKLREVRAHLSTEKRRTSELTRLLRESSTKVVETQQMVSEYSRHIKRMEERVRDAESRNLNAAATANQMRRKTGDRDVIEERKLMQRELERALLESKMRLV